MRWTITTWRQYRNVALWLVCLAPFPIAVQVLRIGGGGATPFVLIDTAVEILGMLLAGWIAITAHRHHKAGDTNPTSFADFNQRLRKRS